jgi:signal transduction histidine kinase
VKPENDSLRHLSTYLCNFAREFLEPANIRCRFDMPETPPDVPLSTEARHNMFLVAKEALNNAVRHSGATEIDLRMRVNPDEVRLEIADNGRGFAMHPRSSAGNGLRNMASRMQDIGGQLEVRSSPEQGTTISMHVPLKPDNTTILPRPTPLGDDAETERF